MAIAVLLFDEQDVYAGCRQRFRAKIYEDDETTPVEIDADNDEVQFLLSTRRTKTDEPLADVLRVTSEAATAEGSTLEIEDGGQVTDPPEEDDGPATCLLTLSEAETEAIVEAWEDDVASVVYMGQFFLIDASQESSRQIFGRGRVHLHRSHDT